MAQMNHETLVSQDENYPYQLSIITDTSDILNKEMKWYQNTIFSENQNDIAQTVNLLNQTYLNSSENFSLLAKSVFGDTILHENGFSTWFHFIARLYNLVMNFISAQLMNDNLYAFSFDPKYLNMTIQELKDQKVRMKYLQVGSMSKCVPQDWFLGYDQFAIYTWLNLGGHQIDEAGHLKTFIRPARSKFNFVNNLDKIAVDYSQDFRESYAADPSGITWYSFCSYVFTRIR